MSWQVWAASHNARLREHHRWRECKTFDGAGPRGVVNGTPVVSFASNDYLGLSHHPAVRAAAHAAIDRWGTGASASRLVTGTRPVHLELEAALAATHKVDRALLFPTGYAANLGALTAFGTDDVTIFSDELNHASIIDGCRLAKAQTQVYRHADAHHLQMLLEKTTTRKIIITESIFSMDGDHAPLQDIAMLAIRHGALLIVDEAHAVFPDQAAPFIDGLEILRIGTLSKTLGSLGGWVGGSQALVDWLINTARSFIFTTALSPVDAAAARAALQVCGSAEGERLRTRLRQLITQLRKDHHSPIIPFILGADETALKAAAILLEHGVYVPAIRPPTVAKNTARLRITLSAAHDDAMMVQLNQALSAAGIAL